ncbi:MAG: thermonuclease family protein [Deltaproteobacteria bacterium]|nr:thermonuclease family protein [Deltaproteobacteria bacterium]
MQRKGVLQAIFLGRGRPVLLLLFCISLLVVACLLAGTVLSGRPERVCRQVRWVNDGDTIVLMDGSKVRYLGIDAPEVAHGDQPAELYGNTARSFNRRLVRNHKVWLEFDRERRDHYGRLLAYVFLADGTFVNGELVRRGYAHLFRGQPDLRYWDRLLDFQRKALQEHKGIWSLPVKNPESYYLGNSKSWIFHRPDCPFGKKTARRNRMRFKDRFHAFYEGFSPCRRCRP